MPAAADDDVTNTDTYFGYTYEQLMQKLDGTGTEADPFLIYDFHDLMMINVAELYCDTEDASRKEARKMTAPLYYKQMNDIDLANTDDELFLFYNRNADILSYVGEKYGLETKSDNFEGVYDGNGHKLINANRALLMGTTANGEVKNIIFENADISIAGGVICIGAFNGKGITNVHVVNSQIHGHGFIDYGVYASTDAPQLIIDGCTIDSSTTISGKGAVGGFFGSAYKPVTFKNCKVEAKIEVEADNNGNAEVGGFAYNIPAGSSIENCISNPEIVVKGAKTASVGGFVSRSAGAWTIKDSQFTGSVQISERVVIGDIYIGGLIGKPGNNDKTLDITSINSGSTDAARLPETDSANRIFVGKQFGALINDGLKQVISGNEENFGYATYLNVKNFNGQITLYDNLYLNNVDGSTITKIQSTGEYTLIVADGSSKYIFKMDTDTYFSDENMYLISQQDTLVEMKKDGFVFAGWYDNSELTGSSVDTLTSGKTYYPRFVDSKITFDGNGATSGSMDVQYANTNDPLTSNDYTKTDYEFVQWYTEIDGEKVTFANDGPVTDALKGEVTLYAEWKKTIIDTEEETETTYTYIVSPITQTYTYTGAEHKPTPEVIVTCNGESIEFSEYEVTYTDNIAAGTATAIVKLTDGTGTEIGTATFTIEKAPQEISYAISAVSKKVGDSFVNPLTKTKGDGTLSYSSSDETVATVTADGTVTTLKDGITTITSAVSETNNYTEATTSYTLKVYAEESVITTGTENVPTDNFLVKNPIEASDRTTLNTNIQSTYAAQFSGTPFFIDITLIDAAGKENHNEPITFTVPYTDLGLPAGVDCNAYAFVVLHLKEDGITVEQITNIEPTAGGLKITSTVSPFAIGYSLKPQTQTPEPSSSSTPKGSTVWLTETPTPTPTPTETQTQPEQAPTSTQSPLPTEAESPLSVLAVLGGLGAACVVLRRK